MPINTLTLRERAIDSNREVVAVTGAAGFLGSHLCEALVSKGAQVIALDNFEIGPPANLNSIANEIQLLQCDITRKETLDFLTQADVVFHLAAIANPRICAQNFERAYLVNVEGTKNVLEKCKPNCRVIFMSGAMTYGDPLYIPMDENHPLLAKDIYPLTKIMGECLSKAAMQTRNLKVTIVRNFSTYGPRQITEYIVPTLISQGLKEGRIEIWSTKPTRDFTYVEDTIDALLRITATDSLIGESVNLGSGNEVQIGSLANVISSLLSGIPVVSLNKEIVGSKRQVCNNRKLREATQWAPRVSLNEGLSKTIEWFIRKR